MLTYVLATALVLAACLGALFCSRPLWIIDQGARLALRWAGVRSRYVQLGDFRMHFFKGGHGKPLVLVHGLAGKAENWARMIPSLIRHGHCVYAIDLLGFGRSDRPDIDYSIPFQVSVLKQFFDSQKLDCADLGGWSMGGWVALKFTVDYPGRVRRLFVADSAGIEFKLPFDPALFQASSVEQARQLLFLLTSHRLLSGFLARDLVRRVRPVRRAVQRSLQSMLRLGDLLGDELSGIRAPVLIIWGKQDALIPVSCAEEMHHKIPQSRLAIFDGCGHLAPAECSGRILPEILQFLDAEPPLPPAAREFAE